MEAARSWQVGINTKIYIENLDEIVQYERNRFAFWRCMSAVLFSWPVDPPDCSRNYVCSGTEVTATRVIQVAVEADLT
jgi:hypothetical protein